MVGEDEVSGLGDEQVGGFDDDALAAEFVDFLDEAEGVHDDAVGDNAEFIRPEDAGRDEVEDVFDTVVDDGVASIIATCGAYDDVRFVGEIIDDFAFSFITPLGADDDTVGH
jgi:hypothetical protein